MFSSFQTVLYASPHPLSAVFFLLTNSVRARHVTFMWLLHGADDVVFADQQKVMFVFLRLRSSEIIHVYPYQVETVGLMLESVKETR